MLIYCQDVHFIYHINKGRDYHFETRYNTRNATLLNGEWYFQYFESVEAYLNHSNKQEAKH